MFSKSITNSSQFLMMPQSSQNLYFHLGMNADDDGFCEHFSIMRMTDSKPDDLRVLQAKNFVCVFDDKVLVVVDWKENNYLRSDRYTPSKYLEIYKQELALLSQNTPPQSGIPSGNQMDTQVRLGKDSIGKDRLSTDTPPLRFGEYNKVKLTQAEYDRLIEDLGEQPTLALITELDQYIASKGKDPYKSHVATIKAWFRRRLQEHAAKNRPRGGANLIEI